MKQNISLSIKKNIEVNKDRSKKNVHLYIWDIDGTLKS